MGYSMNGNPLQFITVFLNSVNWVSHANATIYTMYGCTYMYSTTDHNSFFLSLIKHFYK